MRNEYKKITLEDKFFRELVAVAQNHREVWTKEKRRNRKKYRLFLKKTLTKETNL